MRTPISLLVLSVFATPALTAEERVFIDTPEAPAPSSIQERTPWEEIRSALPPWPADTDLIEFELDAPSPFRYFIDGRHLTIGKDDVVRYTLVARSASGAHNISFEGIRCTPGGLYQIYAYGSGDAFQSVPEPDWKSIADDPGDSLHRELHGHFLCGPKTFEPRPRRDIVRALKGQIAERENAGFLSD